MQRTSSGRTLVHECCEVITDDTIEEIKYLVEKKGAAHRDLKVIHPSIKQNKTTKLKPILFFSPSIASSSSFPLTLSSFNNLPEVLNRILTSQI